MSTEIVTVTAGARYSVGDRLVTDRGDLLEVTAVDGSGGITSFDVVIDGGYTTVGDPVAEVANSYGLGDPLIANGGSGYAVGDTGRIYGPGFAAPIIAVDTGTKTFSVDGLAFAGSTYGDARLWAVAGRQFVIQLSTGNDGLYTIVSCSFDGVSTFDIVVAEAVPSAIGDGAIFTVARYTVTAVSGGAVTGYTVTESSGFEAAFIGGGGWPTAAITGGGSGFEVEWSAVPSGWTGEIATVPTGLKWAIEEELAGVGGGWTDVSADVRAQVPIVCEYGIDGQDPTDRVASTGTLSFAHDNSALNSGGVLGYYSPFATVKRTGFNFNIGCRFWLRYGANKRYKHNGKLDVIQPSTGRYGARLTQCQSVDWMDDAARIDLPSLATATSQSGDQLLTTIMAAMTTTPAATSFDTGASTFTYAFDGSSGQKLKVREELIKIAASEQGYIYIKGDAVQGGTLRFEARGVRTLSPTTALTFDNDMARDGMGTSGSRSDIYSKVQVIVHPTTIAGSVSELWSLSGAETRIRAGETLTLEGQFKDANNNACGGTDMVAPVATTDYTVNTAADGSGTDLTASCSVVATYSGQGVSYAVTNGSGSNGYVTRAVARGKSVTRTDVTTEETVSGSYGERVLVIDLPYGTSINTARNIATYLSTYLSSPVARVKSVKFLANKSDAFMAAAITAEPGDQISITEDATGLVGSLFNIQKIRLELYPGGILWCTWQVTPAGLDAWWTPSSVTTSGGTEVTGAGFKLHKFEGAGSDTFTVSGGDATVEYFGIAAGGGKGSTGSGSLVGGGAAGEPKEGSITLSPGTYTIVRGAAGTTGNNGGNTTFLGFTLEGGRRGGAEQQAGASGVMGGGAGNAQYVGSGGDLGTGGDWQSYPAGTGSLFSGGADEINAGGGGAGAGGGGGAAGKNTGGPGGPGLTRSITGTSTTYGTGGSGYGLSTNGSRTRGVYGSGEGADGAAQDGAVYIRVSTEA